MNQYSNYKPSHIDWIGDIPAHWEVKKLKYAVDKIDEEIGTTDFLIAVENIQSNTGKLVGLNGDKSYQGTIAMFKKGDVVFNKLRPYLAKVYYAEQDGGCLGELLVLRGNDEINQKYLFYRAISQPFIDVVNSSTEGTKMPRANWDDVIKQLPFALPPLDEQVAIATYLDEQTTQLDGLIARKRRLMALLHEEKAALINEAVTKGIHPNVPTKPSGIDWLGDVPAHWEVKRAKHVSSIFIPQRNKPELNQNEGTPWITMDDIKEPYVEWSTHGFFVSSTDAELSGSKVLQKGSVIASCIGNFGVTSINLCPVIINQQLQAFIPTAITADFLRHLISISKPYFEIEATATTIQFVNREKFENLPVCLPPLAEQAEIVTFLDAETAKIDFTVGRIEREIELMQEYRTALISEVVTGKVNVL